jgi:hypothetical protein
MSMDGDYAHPGAHSRVLDADHTTDHAFPPVSPALPFRPAASVTPMRSSAPRLLSVPPRGILATADVTLENPGVAPANPVLPFVAPPAVGRRQRLIHFEPSTGRRLAQPVWVDELEFIEPTAP